MSFKEYTVKVFKNGGKEWFLNGKRHREDGPAVEYADGYNKEWWINGKRHREDGPAIDYANGHKEWYIEGVPHREDGPAVEYANGYKEWYLNGKKLTEEEFLSRKRGNSCSGKIVEIDGVRYQLKEVE
jgi:hypothetical protein